MRKTRYDFVNNHLYEINLIDLTAPISDLNRFSTWFKKILIEILPFQPFHICQIFRKVSPDILEASESKICSRHKE